MINRDRMSNNQCRSCGHFFGEKELDKNEYICPHCNSYFRISARKRIEITADKGSFKEWFEDIKDSNPFRQKDYSEKIRQARRNTGLQEAVVIGESTVMGERIVIGVCDASFLMGSMGRVVGERITRGVEKATRLCLPVFLFCCSGGARMQEGIVSLMQMGKTAASLAKHSEKGLFYCSILTDPTLGGVTASFAMLGDVIVAEPGALIGFAGKRVISQTIGQELPEEFQTAEFQCRHGMIDGVVERKKMRKMIHFLALAHKDKQGYSNINVRMGTKSLSLSLDEIKSVICPKKSPWEKIKAVRSLEHPTALDYISNIFDVFMELKGDRHFGDDKALIGGIALLEGQPVTVIAGNRGRTIEEGVERNFGMPMPEGYRKSLRLMKQAEKFNRPIVTFVNTPGAFCGIGAEERGQGEAIARNLLVMSRLKVPVLAIIIGEAGSGGALATAVGNEVWMFENAAYSILTPEGYASILWKDSSRAKEAAEKMHMEAAELKKLGIIEKIVPEYGGANQANLTKISDYLKKNIIDFLIRMSSKSTEELVEERYRKFRKI